MSVLHRMLQITLLWLPRTPNARGGDFVTAAFASANTNGFDNNGTSNTVTVFNPPVSGPNAGDGEFIEVIINSVQQAGFSQLLFSGSLESTVRAVAQCDLLVANVYAVFGGSTSCDDTIDWSGSNTTIEGGIHSNNDITIGGSDNHVDGEATYLSSTDISGSGNTFDPSAGNPSAGSVETYPFSFAIDDFAPGGSAADAADSAGEYYSTTDKMDMGWLISEGYYNDSTKVLQDGLYYTTNEIVIGDSDVIGNNVTFVARDIISLGGSNNSLSPYVDSILAFTDKPGAGSPTCDDAVISLSGSEQSWNGLLFAPYGLVDMSGSDNSTLNGSIYAYSVQLNGSVMNITVDEDLLPPPPPELNLAE